MIHSLARCAPLCTIAVVVVLGSVLPMRAQSSPEIEALQRQVEELLRQNAEQQRQIERLQQEVQKLGAAPPPPDVTPSAAVAAPGPPTPSAAVGSAPTPGIEEAVERALADVQAPSDVVNPASVGAAAREDALLSKRIGDVDLRLIDVSFDLLTAAGTSTVGGQELRDLQAGAHDPRRRGFTLQEGELSLTGAVDPYFVAQAHVIFTDASVELEEAFFVTTSLPWRLQVRGGYFLTDFGRLNPTHPHAWTYLDQPVIITRLLGPEGLRAPGIEASWLAPLPWFSELTVGMQDGDEGDLTVSFLDDEGAVGGRPAVDTGVHSLSDFIYLLRWANSWDLAPSWTALLGASGLYGTNATGAGASTFIYGADLTLKWRPPDNFRGWPFVVWQSELLKRDYTAARFVAGTATGGDGGGHDHEHGEDDDGSAFPNDLPGGILRDYGFYSQLTWGFTHPWAAAVRLEYATGSGKSVEDGVLVSRQQDPLRGDRLRVSPLLLYQVSHFARLRLQYNYDHATFLAGDESAHTVWLGAELLYGSHAAHEY